MPFTIDLSSIPTTNPLAFGWWFFTTIGWIFPVFLFCYALILFWQIFIRNKYRAKRKYMLLAVDVPKNNENGPKAVENFFNQLSGAHQPLKWYEKWWTGEIPDSFSFEIISLGGYIQFIIHFDGKYRDLIEAITYAQYPDAEIMEIEDYTKDWHLKFPNDQYDLWGTELILAKKEFYPIRLWEEFEHSEEGYKDSMAGLLEALSRIGPGEQVWVQFVVTPADNDWGKNGEQLIKKLIGAKGAHKKTLVEYLADIPNFILEGLNPAPATDTKTKQEYPTLMMHMTPGEKDVVAAVERKIAKIGFHTKIRLIYFAEKNKYNKTIAKTVYGAFKQFNTLDLNAIKAQSKTLTAGIALFKKPRLIARKNKIMYRYWNRGHFLEPKFYGNILNSEELASLYHFPVMTVKAPLVKKAEAKKAEPPMSLPIEQQGVTRIPPSHTAMAEPPKNLPT